MGGMSRISVNPALIRQLFNLLIIRGIHKDLVAGIALHLNKCDWMMFSGACLGFGLQNNKNRKKVITRAAKSGYTAIVDAVIDIDGISMYDTEAAYGYLCAGSCEDALSIALRDGRDIRQYSVVGARAMGRHSPKIAEQIYDLVRISGDYECSNALTNAAKYGHLDTIQWFLGKRNSNYMLALTGSNMLYKALKHSHLHICDWLKKSQPGIHMGTHVIMMACKSGNKTMIDWVCAHVNSRELAVEQVRKYGVNHNITDLIAYV